jgi:microcystin degradation protein MlrC
MRFLIGEFSHESNYFCAATTGEADFRAWELQRGDAVVTAHRGEHTVLGGFIEGLAGNEILGSVAAWTVPSGPVEAAFYDRIKRDLLDAAGAAAPLDGVLLSLHGAMSLDRDSAIVDPEGDLVSALRRAVGPRVPVAAVLDLHSDTTQLLLDSANLTLAYNEEPHRDTYDRGLEAATLVQRICRGELQPAPARVRVPMLLPAINMATDQGPMHDLHGLRTELEKTPGVIDVSLHPGFYGADQPESGFSVVCTTHHDSALARRVAQQMAGAAWRRREDFIVPLVAIETAVREALNAGEPIGLIDEADDPAGGGSGDSVAILRGLLAGDIRHGGISTVRDTEVARRMAAAGEGARLKVLLGAKTDRLHGEPIEIEGTVASVYTDPLPSDSWSGRKYDVGLVAVLDVQGIAVVVTEQKIVTENIDIFEILGYDVRAMQAVGFKGLGLHIRQALAGKIRTFRPVDGVGVTHPDVRRLGPYTRIRRPVWPLDPMPEDAFRAED